MSSRPPPDPASEGEAPVTESTSELDHSELRAALGMTVRRPPVALTEGQVIDDAYRIERPLGAGGMGVVYLARDLRLHRDVAIKVHTAVAGEPGGERLLREATAMAQLVHPHVVTVHEVGTWAGHPYVAMEYVAGGTARTWLAAAPRTARQILALFLAAGRGLAAAHAIGLVHRDFKPDNVLVGDDGRIRVADFGLARGFDEDAGGGAAPNDLPLADVTAAGAILGTPAYMAPEQRGHGKVGPAADQFAFAVAVWEALCGERPFPGKTDAQIVAAIAGGEIRPPPPQRRMPAHVQRALTRALAADPAARFPTIGALITELARDPAAHRRRLALLASAALGVAALGAGAVVLTRADPAPVRDNPVKTCARAGEAIAETWTPARRAAIEQGFVATGRSHAAATATRVGDRLDAYAAAWSAQRVEACRATNVQHEQSAELLDLRDHCLDRKRTELAALIDVFVLGPDAALVDRAIDATLALGALDDCQDVPRLTGVLPRPTDPASRAALTEAEALIAQARADHQAGKFPAGLTAAKAALARAEPVGYAPVTAEARLWLGYLQQSSGDPAGARATFDAATRDAATARDDVLAAEIWVALFQGVASTLQELAEAERLLPYAEAALLRAGSPPRTEAALATAHGLLRARQGRWAEAGPLLARSLTLLEQSYGPDDPRVALTLNLQGNVLRELGDYAQARVVLERALAILDDAYGADHPQAAKTLHNLANLLFAQGRYEEARVAYERVIAKKERLLGADHPDLASSLTNLGLVLVALHRPSEALPLLERARAMVEAKYGPEHPAAGRVLSALGDAVAALGDRPAARAHLERALALLEPALGADNPEVIEVVLALGDLRRRSGELAAARRDLTRARSAFEAVRGPAHADVARALQALAALELAAGDPAAAHRDIEQALAIFEQASGADAPELAVPLTVLAGALAAQGHLERAAATAERAAALHAEAPHPDPAAAADTALVLAQILWTQNQDRPRAVRLAGEARDAWTAAGFADDARRAAAWLRQHR